MVAIADQTATDVHYLQVHKKISGSPEWPQVFVVYADGNTRMKPQPPIGRSDTFFGSSVILGPAAEAERPIAEISEVEYLPGSDALVLRYAEGGEARVTFDVVDRELLRLNVDVDFPMDVPFATVRSMFVADGNADADHVTLTDEAANTTHDPVMTFAPSAATSVLVGRDNWSIHNTSAPDIWLGDFQLDGTAIEAEDAAGDGIVKPRGSASGQQSVLLYAGQSRSFDFDVQTDGVYDVLVEYSNDNSGPTESIEILVDGQPVGGFDSEDTGSGGLGWSNFTRSTLQFPIHLTAGTRQVDLVVAGGDGWGIEIDRVALVTTHDVVPISVEAEAATGDGFIQSRGNASGQQSVLLHDGGTRQFDFEVARPGPYDLVVRYSNDNLPGESEVITALLDGEHLVQFEAADTGSGGAGWDNFVDFRAAFPAWYDSGSHVLQLDVQGGDGWGVEIDRIRVEPGVAVAPIQSEAEDGAGDGSVQYRGSTQTVLLHDGQTRSFEVDVERAGPYDLVIRYSNDNLPGPTENISVVVDGQQEVHFVAEDTGSGGSGWYNFVEYRGALTTLAAGPHVIDLAVADGDGWGIEIDHLILEPGPELLPIELEAEAASGDGSTRYRGNASGQQTVLLYDSQTRVFDFDVTVSGEYRLMVRYSNDNAPGDSEDIVLTLDNQLLTQFEAEDTGSGGSGWENFAEFSLSDPLTLSSGLHSLELSVLGGDGWGIEIDELVLIRV